MPVIPVGEGVDRVSGSSSFVDGSGAVASAKLPYFAATTTSAEIVAMLTLIAQMSNAAEFRRGVYAETIVDLACAAGVLIAFDEAYASVGTVGVMKFKRAPLSPYEYIEIPAIDASLLDATGTYINVSAGTGQSLLNAVLAELGEDGCYVGSYLANRKVKRLKIRPRPALLEPELGALPSGLPDVDNEPGADLTDPED